MSVIPVVSGSGSVRPTLMDFVNNDCSSALYSITSGQMVRRTIPRMRQRISPPTPTADKQKRFGGLTFPIAYRARIGKKASTSAMSISVKPANLDCDHVNLCVTLVAVAIALIGARPYAGSWNDGSRLATVESLVDYHTWEIDNSTSARENPRPNEPAPISA